MRTVMAISPHLDDAVLGCGAFLAARPGAVVLSMFCGLPRRPGMSTPWDSACGFASAAEALAARLREDDAALAAIGAKPCRLDFPDDQYRGADDMLSVDSLSAALRTALSDCRPAAVAMPFGLFHKDHILAHEAALPVCRDGGPREWYAYEDALYRRIPGLLHERLAGLERAGFRATPVAIECGAWMRAKRRAVKCYGSQLRGLSTPGRAGHLDAFAPEGIWRIDRAPAPRSQEPPA